MKDRIITSLMSNFFKKNELSIQDESSAFEEFSTYYVISKIMDGDFTYDNIDEMQIGSGDDGGIDAIGILINGDFFDNIQSLKDMLETPNKNNLTVQIIFVQSKTSNKFQASEMRVFGDGIVDCLREKPQLRQSSRLEEKWLMISEIISHASQFKTINGRAYYVSLGKWTGLDSTLNATISNVIDTVKAQNVFHNFEFKPVDSLQLQNYVTDSETKVSTTIEFPEKTDLPEVPDIEQGWYGYMQLTQFLKLIVDENDDLRRSLFYDNVRDFQGDTPANLGITDTLNSEHPQNMAILNNGITILADSATQIRKSITLNNYQIVNGCQTSYVIYNNRNLDNNNVYLPVKIIVTPNEDISTRITIANNRQTAVKDEDLLALTEVQKELENFFNTFENKKQKLHYERRSNQYNDQPNIEKVRIVPISLSLRAYCSMFMYKPHVASRWYGKLYSDYSATVFDGTKENMTFYTAAFTVYKYNFFIRNRMFERKYSKFKYFILLMIRVYLTGNKDIPTSNKSALNDCNKINAVLWDDDKCKNLMQDMVDIISNAAGEEINSNSLTSSKAFLDILLEDVLTLRKSRNVQ